MKSDSLKYRRVFLVVTIMIAILIAFSIVRLIISLNAVQLSFSAEGKKSEMDTKISQWSNMETRNLQKEIYWLEGQLELSKSDSISLGINLADNVVQVQLKGTTLYQSEILKKNPADFLLFLDEDSYSGFAKVNDVDSETSNVPKKPVKKVSAPKSESEAQPVLRDFSTEPSICWNFKTGNHINVVIFGVPMSADSSFVIQDRKEMLNIRSHDFYRNPFQKSYFPVLCLWLKDTEAKTIYRAVPEKCKVAFRN